MSGDVHDGLKCHSFAIISIKCDSLETGPIFAGPQLKLVILTATCQSILPDLLVRVVVSMVVQKEEARDGLSVMRFPLVKSPRTFASFHINLEKFNLSVSRSGGQSGAIGAKAGIHDCVAMIIDNKLASFRDIVGINDIAVQVFDDQINVPDFSRRPMSQKQEFA